MHDPPPSHLVSEMWRLVQGVANDDPNKALRLLDELLTRHGTDAVSAAAATVFVASVQRARQNIVEVKDSLPETGVPEQ